MKGTGLNGKGRSTTIAATPDDGKARGKEKKKNTLWVDMNTLSNSNMCTLFLGSDYWPI